MLHACRLLPWAIELSDRGLKHARSVCHLNALTLTWCSRRLHVLLGVPGADHGWFRSRGQSCKTEGTQDRCKLTIAPPPPPPPPPPPLRDASDLSCSWTWGRAMYGHNCTVSPDWHFWGAYGLFYPYCIGCCGVMLPNWIHRWYVDWLMCSIKCLIMKWLSLMMNLVITVWK